MHNIILYIIGIIITDLYIFPIELSILPAGINSKLLMAVIGATMFFINQAQKGNFNLNTHYIKIFIYALLVSLIGVFSITYNSTNDTTYSTYIVSMVVWLAAAYVPITYIRQIHKSLSIQLICEYLIWVCLFQCISAIIIDTVPWFKTIVLSNVRGAGFEASLSSLDGSRLYGIGAMLDVAGQKFGCILVMIVYICMQDEPTAHIKKYTPFYIASFLFILAIGNMMGRTTTIGAAVAIIYALILFAKRNVGNKRKTFASLIIILSITIPYLIYRYNADIHFRENIRFGFEGFFSLVEKGKWETHSNNILKNMIRWPESSKTWIIGDGYFDNPEGNDPYYIGHQWKGFYMGTDIGYLRFIYYFGLIGLTAFSLYFLKVYQLLVKNLPQGQKLFMLIVIINFIVWFKVSSDVFMVLAPFILISSQDQEEWNATHANNQT